MTEGFELVRIVRLHIRRSAALLDEGNFDAALAEANSALALDPQSLPAQAMCDRIRAAQAGSAPLHPHAEQPPRGFVPHGVNAASWRGFEQRITERRFKALLDTINTSIVAGDGITARAALEEARELRPDSELLAEFEGRVAAVPVAAPVVAASRAPARIGMRAMGAAALFLVGVSMLLGLEWMRPGDAVVPATAPAVMPETPAVTPTQDAQPAPAPDLGSVPIAINEEDESVPAIVTPPEPLLRPMPTTGSTPPAIASRAVPIADARPAAPVERGSDRGLEVDEPPSGPAGEVSDDFVAARRTAVNMTPDAGPAVAPPRLPAIDTPVNADARAITPAASLVAPAASVPSGIDQQTRVEEVLRRYARAYAQLDASAARAVWPTVDERALARAFQNLSSQQVSFDDCEIAIRGANASASCSGRASYAPKVGNREPRTEPRNWRFELRREGEAWQIVEVEARREPTVDYR
jgi:hypothetical protein